MLFQEVFCVCFVALLALKIETNAQIDSKAKDQAKPEELFADVIKNISRVNNELQNLISNYEHFKKMQSSEENFGAMKEYVSDAEGGRVNRNSKINMRNPSGKSATKSYATEMIFVGDETENSDTEKSSETEKTSQTHKSDEVDDSHEEESQQNIHTSTQEPRLTNKDSKDVRYKDIETKNEEFYDFHNNMKHETDRLKRIVSEAYQEPNKLKYIETEKKTKYLGGNSPKPSSESEISVEDQPHIEEKEEEENNSIRVRDRAFEEKEVEVTAGLYLRSQQKENTTTEKQNNASLESSDNDLSKEEFKANVLRQAYGDACLKLVIRKCHKACKAASTSACRAAIKCKSEFKACFKAKSKAGCVEAFSATSHRRIATPESIDGSIVTQEGYLSVACQPVGRRNLQKPEPAKNNNTDSLNILRDKYERACAKISQKKCITACHNGLQATCNKYECKKSLKKNFKKHCRTNCKKFYPRKSKSSDSDDDSDKDSDDDSDSDSSDDDEDDKDDDDKDDNDTS